MADGMSPFDYQDEWPDSSEMGTREASTSQDVV